MDIHIRDGDIHLLDLRTRMPFRYGIATMTHTPHADIRAANAPPATSARRTHPALCGSDNRNAV